MVTQYKLFDDVTIHPRQDKRRRFQFRFHLDITKDEQLFMGQELEALKPQRKYTSTILDALRLILDLRRGSTDVLRALFPNVVSSIEQAAVERIEPPANNQMLALMQQMADIQAQLASRPTISPIGETRALPAPSAGPKPLNIPKFDTPSFDDDLDTIQLKRDTRTDSAGNFLNSLSALAGNAFVQAAPDDGKQARANFASGLGSLFDDDEGDF